MHSVFGKFMEKKQKNGKEVALTVVINLAVGALIVCILLIGLWFWLRAYTHHGKEIEVPDVVGMYMPEAEPMAQAVGMTIVVTDSTFSNKVPLGAIAEQTPPACSHAKEGRYLYVVLNSSARRQVVLPDVHDLSYRQATASLRAVGVRVSEEYEWEPSEYKDLVLDVKFRGRSLPVGARVDEGSEVTLVVGFGKGTEMVRVPSLLGMTLQEARALLLSQHLTIGTVMYDESVDENGYADTGELPVVYLQSPEAGRQIVEGTMVNLNLSVDLEKAVTTHNTDDEEDWF